MAHYFGTTGDDTIAGTRHADIFDMSQGGNDTVSGGGGADMFYFGAAFTADDSIDGGVTNVIHHPHQILSTVELNGDYSAGVVFGANTMINVAHLILDAGHSYNLTTNATTVSGFVMEINATALGAADTLTFNDSASGSILVESNAGHATIIGGSGNDTFILGSTLNASDHIDGGTGTNTLSIGGDYSGGVALDGSWFTNITTMNLDSAAGNYSFTATGAVVASGSTMLIHGTDYQHPANLNFDGSGEIGGGFSFQYVNGTITGSQAADQFYLITGTVTGGGGNDVFQGITGTVDLGDGSQVSVGGSTGTFNGGAGYDTYNSSSGTFNGGSGTQSFGYCSGTFNLEASSTVVFQNTLQNQQASLYMGASLNANDWIEGNGLSKIFLDGDYSAGLSLSNIGNIGTLSLAAGHSYNFTTGDSFAASHTIVDGSQLGDGDSLIFDASANGHGVIEIDGGGGDDVLTGSASRKSTLSGGHGHDILTGGSSTDTLIGGGGADILDGGSGGNDKFIYKAATDSSGIHYDTIIGFDVTRDFINTPVNVTGIDAIVSSGALDDRSSNLFNDDLTAAVDSTHLLAGHAVLYTPTSGDLAGHTFLIVDQNGIAGYQTNGDLVIDVTQSSNITSLALHDFR